MNGIWKWAFFLLQIRKLKIGVSRIAETHLTPKFSELLTEPLLSRFFLQKVTVFTHKMGRQKQEYVYSHCRMVAYMIYLFSFLCCSTQSVSQHHFIAARQRDPQRFSDTLIKIWAPRAFLEHVNRESSFLHQKWKQTLQCEVSIQTLSCISQNWEVTKKFIIGYKDLTQNCCRFQSCCYNVVSNWNLSLFRHMPVLGQNFKLI